MGILTKTYERIEILLKLLYDKQAIYFRSSLNNQFSNLELV